MSLVAQGLCVAVLAAIAAGALPTPGRLSLGALKVQGRSGLRRQPEIKSEIEKEIASRLHDKELRSNASASAPGNASAPNPRAASPSPHTKGLTAVSSSTRNASSGALRGAGASGGPEWRVPTAAPTPVAPRRPLGPCSLLVFWAVGAQPRVMELVKKDIEHLRSALGDECRVDVFLAHYDLKKSSWVKKQGAEWYKKNVQYSAERLGYKFQLMKSLFADHNLSGYDWVWALDEDVDFSRTDLRKMLSLAQESGALIALPAFTEDGRTMQERELDYSLQFPDPRCQYRYAPVVEVIFPLMQATALQHILKDCTDCIHEKSTWGLDRVWCHYSARAMGHKLDTACAILDATPVVHRNYKTLKEKYKVGKHRKAGEYSDAFYNMARADFGDVKKHHPNDFVDGPAKSIQSSKCAKKQR